MRLIIAKKYINKLLIVFLILSLVGCTKDNKQDSKNEDGIIVENGYTYISIEKLKSYIQKVDITNDNWRDYFVIEYNTYENKDSFGEVTSTRTDISFANKNDPNVYYSSGKLKLHDNLYDIDFIFDGWLPLTMCQEEGEYYGHNFKSGDLIWWGEDANGQLDYRVFDLDNLTCIQASGYLYLISIPEELISDEGVYYYTDSSQGYIKLNFNDIDEFYKN